MAHHPGKGRGVGGKTFSMTRVPPKRVTNSAVEATVKSRCRSIFLCSRPFFARCSPDMLGLQWDGMAVSELVATQANPHQARGAHCCWLGLHRGVGSAESPAACSSGDQTLPPPRFFLRKAIKPFTLLIHAGNIGIHFPCYHLPVVHRNLSRDI